MATIQNDRDVLLQAASPRVVPVPIPIDQVIGLPGALDDINNELASQGTQITSVLNNTKDLLITASSTVFSGSSGATTPPTITLTAVFKNGLSGTVTWSVTAGSATLSPSGNTCVVTGSTVSGQSVTIRARLVSGNTYDAYVTLAKLGTLSAQAAVDLTTQVTGQLATGNITGLGALALLNTVNLSTQTTGALNGVTQVTNLGDLAYANAIAANQIGAGTLAAGVIYAGTINASQVNAGSFTGKEFTGGTFTGSTFRTATSGRRVELNNPSVGADTLNLYDIGASTPHISFSANSSLGSEIGATSSSSSALTVKMFGASGSYPTAFQILSQGSGAYISADRGIGIDMNIGAVTPSAHFRLNPQASFPSSASFGDLMMHSTHGLCGYNGSAWVKFTTTTI